MIVDQTSRVAQIQIQKEFRIKRQINILIQIQKHIQLLKHKNIFDTLPSGLCQCTLYDRRSLSQSCAGCLVRARLKLLKSGRKTRRRCVDLVSNHAQHCIDALMKHDTNMELIGGSILVVMLTIKLDTQVTIGVNEQKPCEVAKSRTNGWPDRVLHHHHYHHHRHHNHHGQENCEAALLFKLLLEKNISA